MERKKLITTLVLTVTLVLTLTAVFTAFKLYRVGKKPEVAPTPPPLPVKPSASPAVPEIFQAAPGVCELSFNVQASPTPTPTPVPGCWDVCETDSQCPSGTSCLEVNGTDRCVNPICPTKSNCVCATPTPTPTPTPTAPPTSTPTPTPTPGQGGPTPTPTLTPTPTPTTTPTPSPTPSPTPIPQCWDTCQSDSQCSSSLRCLEVNGTDRCVNPSCSEESDCVCAVAAPELPSAGIISPTIAFGLGGILLILLGLLF